MGKCVLCSSNAVINRQENASRNIYNCHLCGVFVVSDLVTKEVKEHANKIAAYLMSRKLAGRNDIVLISFDKATQDKGYLQMTVDQIVVQFPRRFSEQVDMVLRNLSLMSCFAGDELTVEDMKTAPLFYAKKSSFEALSFVIKAMAKQELIDVNYFETSFFPCGITITPQGWDRLAEIDQGRMASEVALLSSPREEREEDENSGVFRNAARKAAKECGFQAVETGTISAGNKINFELIAQIKHSRFVVCDLSGGGGEGYYTAAMAQALGKVCILTCHKSARHKLDFDIEQINVLLWDAAEKLQLHISSAIRAAVL